MLKIRRPLGRLIFNMGIAIPGKTVFLIETAPWSVLHADTGSSRPLGLRQKPHMPSNMMPGFCATFLANSTFNAETLCSSNVADTCRHLSPGSRPWWKPIWHHKGSEADSKWEHSRWEHQTTTSLDSPASKAHLRRSWLSQCQGMSVRHKNMLSQLAYSISKVTE